MDNIIIENTEKTPIKVAEKYIELDEPSRMYVIGFMQGYLSKSQQIAGQNKSA